VDCAEALAYAPELAYIESRSSWLPKTKTSSFLSVPLVATVTVS
jgi:hypothetical protein